MTATRWSVADDPEEWYDNPASTPEKAVEEYLSNGGDDTSDTAHDIGFGIPKFFTVHEYFETSAPLLEDDQFDDYEPGQTYWMPSGTTVEVRVSLAFDIVSPKDTP